MAMEKTCPPHDWQPVKDSPGTYQCSKCGQLRKTGPLLHEDKIIEHLSSEITTQGANVMMFRARLSFTILIGPFVLLGSFLVATTEPLPNTGLSLLGIIAAIIAALSYIGLGCLGAVLDHHITRQCNDWRRQIDTISRGGSLDLDEFQFLPQTQVFAYPAFFLLALIAFVSMSVCLGDLLLRTPA